MYIVHTKDIWLHDGINYYYRQIINYIYELLLTSVDGGAPVINW